jgi:phosphonoacetate hydrolase
MADEIEVNGRRYRVPGRPVVVICFDGCDPAYLRRGIPGGVFPVIGGFRERGFLGEADCVIPSFTNPNNVSIVTGVPPAVHGIAGNYYLDRGTGQEVMITDASLMRGETILAAMAQAGMRVAAVTAKDKLRKMLGKDLRGICFSSECADRCSVEDNGIVQVEALVGRAKPDMYSDDLSLFVLDAGTRLLEQKRADLLYLSLSDYVQHAHSPGEPEADAFNRAVDERVGRLVELGAVVGVVADHGMNDKPRVIFLEDELNERFWNGVARVICPITDPFVRHHGALGSFVRVYRRGDVPMGELMAASAELMGVARVIEGGLAAEEFELPEDREGDFVVLGDRWTAIGARKEEHDLSGVAGQGLRSHGGFWERRVPFAVSERLNGKYGEMAARGVLRNYDIFSFVLNGV